MKLYNKRNLARLAIVILIATNPAIAKADTQLSLGYSGTYDGNISLAGASGSLGTGDDFVFLTAFQASYVSGGALPFSANPFYTFCFDIGQDLILSASWQAMPLPTGANGNTIPYIPGGLQRAVSLYNSHVGSVDISTIQGELNGAALQLAIWNDLYDGDSKVESGTFSVSGGNSGALMALADSFLESNGNVADPNATATFLNASEPNQDLLGPAATLGFVPEPAVYTIAASACAFLGLLGIRGIKGKAGQHSNKS